MPCDSNFLLKPSIDAFASPAESLPWQKTMSPLAFSIDLGSMTFAPSVVPVSSVLVPPLLPPPPSSSPQPATRPPISAAQPSHRATCRFHFTGEPLLLVGLATACRFAHYPSLGTSQPGGAVEPRSTISSGIRRLEISSPDTARSSRSAPRLPISSSGYASGVAPVRPADRPLRHNPCARGGHRRLEALAPVGAGVEAEQVLLLVAQEGDPPVAERQQVLGRHAAAFH